MACDVLRPRVEVVVWAWPRNMAPLQRGRSETTSCKTPTVEISVENTGRHVARIADTSRKLAEAAGLDPATVSEIGWSSMLHDVGKLHVPDNILVKAGALTPQEWEIMELHTILGERILGSGEGFEVARRIARSHHENFDGSGYPDRLRGEDIPFEARIVRITDSFDAITHSRPYSRARSVHEALEEIERWAGKQFDPELARLFIAIVPTLRLERRLVERSPAVGVTVLDAKTG